MLRALAPVEAADPAGLGRILGRLRRVPDAEWLVAQRSRPAGPARTVANEDATSHSQAASLETEGRNAARLVFERLRATATIDYHLDSQAAGSKSNACQSSQLVETLLHCLNRT